MKKCCFFIALCFAILLCGCSVKPAGSNPQKVQVVASLFPQYDFAKQIAKDKADVSLLLPPGVESHSFDPSPSDIMKISGSDIFLYTGKEMEPWADKVISGVKGSGLSIVNVSEGIPLFQSTHEHSHNEHEHHQHKYDPHIWMDPTLAVKMVDNILVSLCEKDPQNAEFYKNNAEKYKKELLNLDHEFSCLVERSKRKSVAFGGRFAHLYFINRYGLNYMAAFDGCSAESEPSVKRIAKIISFIKENEIPCIYYEELAQPKVANSIAEQTGAKTLKFSTIHNVTKEQLDSGTTYIDLMRENLHNLELGLN